MYITTDIPLVIFVKTIVGKVLVLTCNAAKLALFNVYFDKCIYWLFYQVCGFYIDNLLSQNHNVIGINWSPYTNFTDTITNQDMVRAQKFEIRR